MQDRYHRHPLMFFRCDMRRCIYGFFQLVLFITLTRLLLQIINYLERNFFKEGAFKVAMEKCILFNHISTIKIHYLWIKC